MAAFTPRTNIQLCKELRNVDKRVKKASPMMKRTIELEKDVQEFDAPNDILDAAQRLRAWAYSIYDAASCENLNKLVNERVLNAAQ